MAEVWPCISALQIPASRDTTKEACDVDDGDDDDSYYHFFLEDNSKWKGLAGYTLDGERAVH